VNNPCRQPVTATAPAPKLVVITAALMIARHCPASILVPRVADLAVQRKRPAALLGYLIHGRDKTLEPFPVLVQVVTHEFPVPGVVE
jgi:hypothetical protein